MDGSPLPRQVAQQTVEALKKAGHIVLTPGEGEQLLRDLGMLIAPVIQRILPRINLRGPLMGEPSSTFGDEATDELVEELVEEIRDALLDSESVEDVFADDRTMDRAIFRALSDSLRALGRRSHEEDDDEEEMPPISVRLDTLGYVASSAARGADQATLKDALDRAAEAADSELKSFEAGSRTAFFRPAADPERRIDIEAAIEEELSDLVEQGIVDLPSVKRKLDTDPIPEARRRAVRLRLDELVEKHLSLAVCRGTWEWSDDKTQAFVVFIPLAEPDEALFARVTADFEREIRTVLATPESADDEPAVPSSHRPARSSMARRFQPESASAAISRSLMDRTRDLLAAIEAVDRAPAKRAKAAVADSPVKAKKADKPAAAEKADKAAKTEKKPRAAKKTSDGAAPRATKAKKNSPPDDE
ncbi:MAG: hypothetical protein U0271_25735 [Polyangiaceae bacterium]